MRETSQTACRTLMSSHGQVLDRLSPSSRSDFESLMHSSSYPAHTVLFTEGESAKGLYIVLQGEIRVSINSADGKRLSLRIARRGDLLGLSAVAACGYSATAETLYWSARPFLYQL